MKIWVLLFVSIFIVTSFSSCVSNSSRDRGSLSAAMDKARDDHGEDRNVPDQPSRREIQPDENRDLPQQDSQPNTSSEPLPIVIEDVRLAFGLRGGQGLIHSLPMSTNYQGDLLVGYAGKDLHLLGYLGFMTLDPLPASSLDQSIKDYWGFIRLGLEFRWFPLKDWFLFSPHLDFGFGAFMSGWEYKNPLQAGNETIKHDNLGGFLFSLGAGVDILALEHMRAGIKVVPKVYFFGETTTQGFSNDYFSPLGTVSILGEILFR